jgi:LemA protein
MIGIILLIVVVVLVVLLIGIYNRLVALRQNTNQAFADIDVQLKQRHDLIPNLVETVKGYAAHESGTLEAVIQARNSAISAEKTGDPKAMGQAEGVLGAALGRLIALSEAYPDLKANQNFIKLQDELSDIENKLAAARRFFNNAVGEYNTAREQFPASTVAGPFGFGPRQFFDVGQDRATLETAPQVKFS